MSVRLLFQDEARFGRLSDERRCWAPWPERPCVGKQIIREYTYGLVAVSPHDGKFSSLVLPGGVCGTTKGEWAKRACEALFDGEFFRLFAFASAPRTS
ncbi:MAG: hypothetical protein ACRD18_04080, partial [Terriglobia bacterium]